MYDINAASVRTHFVQLAMRICSDSSSALCCMQYVSRVLILCEHVIELASVMSNEDLDGNSLSGSSYRPIICRCTHGYLRTVCHNIHMTHMPSPESGVRMCTPTSNCKYGVRSVGLNPGVRGVESRLLKLQNLEHRVESQSPES